MCHVDDAKVSHVDPQVVTDVFNILESSFGKMKIVRGNIHDFLGMKLIYQEDGNFRINMQPYLEETVAEFNETPMKAATPAKADLFYIDEKPLVDEKRRRLFHRLVFRLMHSACRGRKDLRTAISFLSKRPNFCNEGDYCKLRRLMHYMHATLDLEAIIGIKDIGVMTTFIDAAFAVHDNKRSHTGAATTFGIGVFASDSKMQRLNTTSSTESELVALGEYLPRVVFIHLFMEAQGYPLEDNIICRDNESAIKLEINGRKSCSKRSHHIDIRYFYVKDLIDKNIVKIQYCPTEKMLADFFTKPLQGNLFRYFRSFILGHRPLSELKLLTSKERVN